MPKSSSATVTPSRLQRVQCLDRYGARLQHGFGQLELEALRRQVALAQQLLDVSDEVASEELLRGGVDGDSRIRPGARAPFAQASGRVFSTQSLSSRISPDCSAIGEELPGGQHRAVRLAPAQQRFGNGGLRASLGRDLAAGNAARARRLRRPCAAPARCGSGCSPQPACRGCARRSGCGPAPSR